MLATIISAVLLILAGCGGGGGGGGGGSVTPSLPANAVTITDANAMTIADAAVGTIAAVDSVRDALSVEADTLPSMQQAIHLVTDKIFSRARRTYTVATGLTGSEPCYYGGSISYSYSETATSESGTATFNNCDEGIVINGSISYSSTWNNSTYAYTDTLNGSLTFTYGSDSFTLTMNLSETGNSYTGDYNETVTYSVSGIPGGGFLVTTRQTIVGNYYAMDIYSGEIIVQGANNTRLRITVTATNTADVYLDNGNGIFVLVGTINLTYY